MTDSTSDLRFTDYNEGKTVGYHDYESFTYKPGEGLINKEAKEIIIPSLYLGKKIIEIGVSAFRETNSLKFIQKQDTYNIYIFISSLLSSFANELHG